MNRPTYKELDNKINEARNAVEQGLVNLINPEALASDALELGYSINDELISSLSSVLDETQPDHYAGKRPPALSYEHTIMTNALYAFRTKSAFFSCLVYLKFTLFENELWVVSFHKNRQKQRRTF
jgi:hypothetical protein